MKNLFVIMSNLLLCFYSDYGWSATSASLVWESLYTKTSPTVDGKMDKIWEQARPLTVVVREAMGGDNPTEVVLRALHTDDTFLCSGTMA